MKWRQVNAESELPRIQGMVGPYMFRVQQTMRGNWWASYACQPYVTWVGINEYRAEAVAKAACRRRAGALVRQMNRDIHA